MSPEVYNLDLEAMLATLIRRRLSGTLLVDLPRGRGRGEAVHIEIAIDHGKISSCTLTRGRLRLSGNEAVQAVARLGTLPWTFELAQSQDNTAITRAVSSTWIPRRLPVSQGPDFQQLSHLHFLVFACVDGRKNVETIATLLHVNVGQVKNTLLDLEKLRFVGR